MFKILTYFKTPKGKNWLIAILLGLLLAATLWFIFRPIKGDEWREYIKAQNDSLRNEIKAANIEIKESNARTDSMLTNMKAMETKIIHTNERTQIIVNHYDTASVQELRRFFTDRYR